MKSVFPMWMFILVAVSIALAAFAVGQLFPGGGVSIAAFGTMAWTAYVARRGVMARRG